MDVGAAFAGESHRVAALRHIHGAPPLHAPRTEHPASFVTDKHTPPASSAPAFSHSLTPQPSHRHRKLIITTLSRVPQACVYFTPLAGGYLADRHFGQRKMVIAGGAIMAAGHATMASDRLALVGLLLIAIGNGAFKPNISTQVGGLYARDKTTARRDSAFSVFYCGINLGAAIAPLVTGSLRDQMGFPAGFTAAGVGMGVGLAVFILGNKFLPPDAFTTRRGRTDGYADTDTLGRIVFRCSPVPSAHRPVPRIPTFY